MGFLFILAFQTAQAQQSWPFSDEIAAFVHQDSLHAPEKGGILFVGSSSIRKWTDLQERFHGFALIRRGFGGSTFLDLLHYASKIVWPYRPSKIFVYEGENDLAFGQSEDSVYSRFLQFYAEMRSILPETKMYFISIKPDPSRMQFLSKVIAVNHRIQAFCLKHPCHISYLDVYHPMMEPNGHPNPAIFVSDSLHMNAKGYDIWQSVLSREL